MTDGIPLPGGPSPSSGGARAVPLLGDTSLEYVQVIEHSLEGGFAPLRIANLPGELQQRSGRPSHRIRIAGVLFGEQAADQLSKLQQKAASGEELNFSADITKALDLQMVVITSFHVVEMAGRPGYFRYEVCLAESPPLPPPAQVESFGGLDDFGLGDLGFDTDILGDLQSMAGDIAGAVNDAVSAIDKLSALANLAGMGGLDLGGFMQPLDQAVKGVGDLAGKFGDASRGLGELFSK